MPHRRAARFMFRGPAAPRGFTLIELLLIVAVIGLLIAMLLPAVMAAREAARRAQCASQLRQIGIALNGYCSATGRFPAQTGSRFYPGGIVLPSVEYSPFTRILAQLDQPALFNAINFLSVGDYQFVVNDTVMRISLGVLLCPSDSPCPVPGYGRVNYRVSEGSFPFSNRGSSKYRPPTDSDPFSYWSFYSPADFRDGLSQTVGVSERQQGDWTRGSFKPRGDLPMDPRNYPAWFPTPDALSEVCRSLNPTDFAVESRGGESWFLPGLQFDSFNTYSVPNTVYGCLFDTDREPLVRRLTTIGDVPATSAHPGGVNAMAMDGHVQFVRETIDLRVWRALGTRDGGELIPAEW